MQKIPEVDVILNNLYYIESQIPRNGRISGSNSFGVVCTKLYNPTKNKLLFLQIMRQKIEDMSLIYYFIKIFF